MLFLMLLLVVLAEFCVLGFAGLKIALHAQVHPREKVVGSVLTTDGMKSALSKRQDIERIETLYPFEYTVLQDLQWDLILIEGWFPVIDTFINLARIQSPKALIVFYCLDLAYPGFSIINALDVDAYLTNSYLAHRLLSTTAPSKYLPLATDPDELKPISSKKTGVVYVGAGGQMLASKPLLIPMLLSSIPYGLRIYGSHWDKADPQLLAVWKGPLPRADLRLVYNNASAVLACVVEEQRDAGMINNRIFEALACGNVVISDDSSTLRDFFGNDTMLYVQSGADVETYLLEVTSTEPYYLTKYNTMRKRARSIIMKYHTWSHRVIEIIDFYHIVNDYRDYPQIPNRVGGGGRNATLNHRIGAPKLILITSAHITTNRDYLFVIRPSLFTMWASKYHIIEVTETEWAQLISDHPDKLLQYSVIFAIFAPFDSLHFTFLLPPLGHSTRYVSGKYSAIQKVVCYILGPPVPPNISSIRSIVPWYTTLTDVFDAVFYRDAIDREMVIQLEEELLLEYCRSNFNLNMQRDKKCPISSTAADLVVPLKSLRWQHLFGRPFSTHTNPLVEERRIDPQGNEHMSYDSRNNRSAYGSEYDVIICVITMMNLCSSANRRAIISQKNLESYRLVLIGGNLSDWFSSSSPFSSSELADDLSVIITNEDSAWYEKDILSRTVHLSGSSLGSIDGLICASRRVSLFNYGDSSTTQNVGQGTKDSEQYELWPLVISATCDRHIHFPFHPPAPLLSVLSPDFTSRDPTASNIASLSDWTIAYHQQMWTYAAQRVVGFPSCHSTVEMDTNYESEGTIVLQWGTNPTLSHGSLLITPRLSHFIPGVDGQVCLERRDSGKTPTILICLLRQSLTLKITFDLQSEFEYRVTSANPISPPLIESSGLSAPIHHNPPPPPPSPLLSTMELRMVLRGLSSDVLYRSEPYRINIVRVSSLEQASPHNTDRVSRMRYNSLFQSTQRSQPDHTIVDVQILVT